MVEWNRNNYTSPCAWVKIKPTAEITPSPSCLPSSSWFLPS
jgi:hypothetical protein